MRFRVFSGSLLLSASLFFLSAKPILATSLPFFDDFSDGNSDGWQEYSPDGYWSINNGEYYGYSPRQTPSHTLLSTVGDISWNNYSFEVDVKGIDGVGKSVVFYVDNNQNGYVVNLQGGYSNGGNKLILAYKQSLDNENAQLITSTSYTNSANIWYHIRIEVKNENLITKNIKVFVNDEPIIETFSNYGSTGGAAGFDVYPGGAFPFTSTIYDNVKIEPLAKLLLSVPPIFQYSPPWGSQEYDTAHKWSNNPTIDHWGCALTSASMVLQYYGHNINPDGLNSWLNSQPDGYLRNGSLNWLAVSRYTKIHDTSNSPSLEFRRYGANNTTLENELNNQRPMILSFPGHFVVAKGKNDIDFLVNDPQSASNQTISDVSASTGGSYSAIDSFIPSHTNLSYILLAASGNTNLKVFDNHGDEITGFTYSEAPLIDDLNKADTSGESLTIFAYPTPAEGIYQVTLSGQDTQLDSFLYDIDGNVTENHLEDNQSNDDQNFLINIGEDQKIVEINYKTLITTLDNSYKEGLISSFRVYRNIRSLILTSEFFSVHRHGRSKIPQLFLGIASKTVKFYTPTFIEESTSNLLLKEIEILKTQI